MRPQLLQELHESPLAKIVTWISSFLSLGTIAGLVNIFLGLASGAWICWQLYLSVKYDLPMKRARAQKVLHNERDPSPTDAANLE